MKSYNRIAIFLFCTVTFIGCKKSFLNLQPKDQLIAETTFSNYSGFKAYAWNFYGVFTGYGGALQNSEFNSDLFLSAVPNGRSTWIWQLITIPSSSTDYSSPYANIRTINTMLDNIENSLLTDAEKKHWRSVGYFFRAYNYADLVNKYGDIPYIDHTLTDADSALYTTRTPRDEVARHILDDLIYAEQNINPVGDGPNTINTNVVRALMSRFGLREGTWRKYHGLGNSEMYLQASATASEKLMASFPTLQSSYDLDFNSESLSAAPGIILYKQYVANQITHALSSSGRNSSGRWDLTKAAADLFLMQDGRSRFSSPLFTNDKTPNEEFKNRDYRFYFNVSLPYKVNTTPPSKVFTYTGVPEDTMYFGLMNRLSTPASKTLPTINWNGFVVRQEPHFVDNPLGQPYSVTYTGYRFYKFVNHYVLDAQGQDITDCPVFRMGEILVNYAEAKYELSSFDQTVANNTINKLRARGNVAALNIASIANDPSRDPGITAILWEIRRERAVELMGEGFRFDDLRRWKKMDYAVKPKLGRWIKKGADGLPANSIIPIQGGASEGYISYEGIPPSPFPDYYYLYPIPSAEIILNPKIKQNPDWK